MDEVKLKSRRASVSNKADSPIKRKISQSIERREREASSLLEKLQAANRPKSGPTQTIEHDSTRLTVKAEDTKTVKEKVKSAENLSGKGLLAADLIKNLQTQNKLVPRRGSQGCPSFTVVQNGAGSGPQRRGAKSARYRNSEEISIHRLEVPRPRSEVSARQPDFSGDLLRRASLPATEFRTKRQAAAAILQKYKSTSTVDEESDEVSLPSITRVRSANAICQMANEQPRLSNEERDARSRRRCSLTPRDRIHSPSKELESPRTIVARFRAERQKTSIHRDDAKLDESDKSSSSETESNSENEKMVKTIEKKRHGKQHQPERVSKSERISKPEKISKSEKISKPERISKPRVSATDTEMAKKQRCPSAGASKKSDSVRESDDSSDSESENESSDDNSKDENDSDEESDTGKKESTKKEERDNSQMAPEDEDSSDSDDEAKTDSGLVEDALFIDEELEKLSKEMIAPGMPAIDLQEVHEKLLNEGLVENKARKKIKGNEEADEIEEDVEDLIDTIDDLLEADDEDITYATKQELKKKTFKSNVKLVLAARQLSKKSGQ